MRLRQILWLCLMGLPSLLCSQRVSSVAAERWADSLLQHMSLERMAAQTLMMPAWSRDRSIRPDLLKNVEELGIGGIIFFQGHPLDQAYLSNFYQQQSAIPLLIGMDAEWGLSMRLNDLPKYPFAISMGAADDAALALELGRSLGRECRLLGVHISFGPVVDVNTNPDNPIIGFRSFGENPEKVSNMAKAQIQGMQEQGILACAKHFPGHGNTASDSHKELPIVTDNRAQLQAHLTPFQRCIDEGVASIMVAHLEIPALESKPGLPSSLSRAVVQNLLRDSMHFEGLIITDALNMKGVSGTYKSAPACIMAMEAGNDILLFPEDAKEAVDSLTAAVRRGRLDSVELRQHARRILIQKFQAGLSQYKPVETASLMDSLIRVHQEFQEHWSASHLAYPGLSVLDPTHQLPIPAFSCQHGLLLQWVPEGKSANDALDSQLIDALMQNGHWYISSLPSNATPSDIEAEIREFPSDCFVLIAHTEPRIWGKTSRELPAALVAWLNTRNPSQTALLHAGNPYALRSLGLYNRIPVLLSYENDSRSLAFAADALYGRMCGGAQLPATLNSRFPAGYCAKQVQNTPLWETGEMESTAAQQASTAYRSMANTLDARIEKALSEGDFPAAQCVVMHQGKVVYQRAVGLVDSDPQLHLGPRLVNFEHVFDLASITKAAATTLAVMHLCEERKIQPNTALSSVWPEAKLTPWGHLPLSAFLTHQSGLPAFLSFFSTMKSQGAEHRMQPDSQFNLALSNSCFVEKRWSDSAWNWIRQTTPLEHARYLYSDLNMIIMGKWVEYMSQTGLNRFVDSLFYQPMGLNHLGYLPEDRGMDYWCVPSGRETAWPRERICGIVHDPSAAVLGGVSGNAGLFGNAHELAALFQMLCDGGLYSDRRYLNETTVKQFSKAYSSKNHRGLGFDRTNGKNNIFVGAPSSLFGHSGFTGTWAWTDPNENLVFVFLSNRTYPDESNKGLIQKGVRGDLLQIVYRYLP
jgi:beta-N-acetylhexosaminidase